MGELLESPATAGVGGVSPFVVLLLARFWMYTDSTYAYHVRTYFWRNSLHFYLCR